MKLRETVEINAPRDMIWNFLVDPSRWLGWNEKLVHISRSHPGPLTVGEQFGSRWRMKGREQETEIIVQDLLPLQRLVTRQYFNSSNRSHFVEITFDLTTRGSRTKLTQIIDHSESGANLFFRMLIWAIHRFGKPVGPTSLQILKRLSEGA